MNQQKRRRKYSWGTLTTEERKGYEKIGRSPYRVWVYRYFGDEVDGKRKRLKVIVGRTDEMTEDEALFAIESLRMQANAEHPQGSVTMSGLIALYTQKMLEPCFVALGGVQSPTARMSHGCVKTYLGELRNWIEPKWGAYAVRDFERPEIQSQVEDWLAEIVQSSKNPTGRAPGGAVKLHNVMRQLFKMAKKRGYIAFNPLADDSVELPPGATSEDVKKKAPQLSAKQFFDLLANLDVLGLLTTAFLGWLVPRRSEGFGAKWQDLDLDQAVMWFRQGCAYGRTTRLKTRASRASMPIPPEVVMLLRHWHTVTPYNAPQDWVFASPHTNGARPYWPDSIMRVHIRPVALKLGLPRITWNSFRHSVGRWAKRALKLEDAKELLRHKKLSTTSEIYGGMSLDEKRTIQEQFVADVKRRAKEEGWKEQSNQRD